MLIYVISPAKEMCANNKPMSGIAGISGISGISGLSYEDKLRQETPIEEWNKKIIDICKKCKKEVYLSDEFQYDFDYFTNTKYYVHKKCVAQHIETYLKNKRYA